MVREAETALEEVVVEPVAEEFCGVIIIMSLKRFEGGTTKKLAMVYGVGAFVTSIVRRCSSSDNFPVEAKRG